MSKNNWFMGFLFSINLFVLAFMFTIYSNQSKQSDKEALLSKIEKPIYKNNNKPDNVEAEANTVALQQLKVSIDELNKGINGYKKSNDARIHKIEELLGSINTESETIEEAAQVAPATMEEEATRRHAIAVAQTTLFDNALAEEERDEAWATSMEDTMWVASQNDMYAGSNFSSPSCKSTFCQFEAFHNDEESRDRFENIRRVVPNSFHIQHFEEGGELRSVIYFIRNGEEPNNVIFQTLNNS